MRESEAYLEIAERYLESCEKHITNKIDIQEVVAFKAYHAFESIGGAFNSHLGVLVPRVHERKINSFVTSSRHRHGVNGRSVALVAMLTASIRNRMLYPDMSGAQLKNPKDQLSMADAEKLVSRVKGILRQVKGFI